MFGSSLSRNGLSGKKFIKDVGRWLCIMSTSPTSTATGLKENKQILTEDESGVR